jgi:hypothetical protein
MFQRIRSAESEYVMNEILTRLSSGNSQKVVLTREKFSGHIFVEPNLALGDKILVEEVINVLEDLSLSGYLSKNESFSTYCVKCFNTSLMFVGRCPNCGSTQLRAGRELVHICGYTGFENMFNQNGRLVCPACNRELRKEGSDYRSNGSIFRCVSCSRLFSSYKASYECASCGASYEKGSEPSLEVISYELTEKYWAGSLGLLSAYRLRDNIALNLGEAGYRITAPFYHETKLGNVFLDLMAEGKEGRIGVKLYPLSLPEESILVDNLLSARSIARLSKLVVVVNNNISTSATSKLAKSGIILVKPDLRSAELAVEFIRLNKKPQSK